MLMCFLLRLEEYINDELLRSLLLERYTYLINQQTFKENIQNNVWDRVDHHLRMAQMLALLNVGTDIIKVEITNAKQFLQNHILLYKLIQLRLHKGGCLGSLGWLPTDCMRYISNKM
jgi:hypothetical protein